MSGSSKSERLVYMANQIAMFFESQPRANAPLEIADHLNAFWEPSMRQEIIVYVDAGGAGLRPEAVEAVKLLKRISPKAVEVELIAEGNPSVGHSTGDDAG